MIVIKRSGEKQQFDVDKIYIAVSKAFKSVHQEVPEYLKHAIRALFTGIDIIGVEEIQDRVEQLLMHDNHYRAAKSYILYREKHKEARFIKERLDYMDK